MSSKRRRGQSSRSESTFDATRFTSATASERYHNIMETKTFVLERGLKPDPQLDGHMALMIAERNWGQFVEQPGPAVIPIVKEFYANAIDRVGHVVQVRGKSVSFASNIINAYYNIPPFGHGHSYEDSGVSLDHLIRNLCKPGTTWTLRAHTTEKVSFPHSALSKYGKAWYAFICATMMPTRHQNDVTKDRALLLHGIVGTSLGVSTYWDVDVGMVIQASIERFLQGGTTGGIPHGSLITGLCLQAGVQWQSSAPLQQPMAIIDRATIDKYKAWDGAISHPRGLGYIVPLPSPPGAPETSTVDTNARFQRRSVKQNLRLAQRQTFMHQYNVGAFTALADALSQLNPNASPIHLPDPSVLPPYPPSDSEEADSSDQGSPQF